MRTVELCWCVCSLGTGDGESEHLKLMTHCASFQEMGSERLSTPTPKTPVLPTYIRPQSRERKRDEAFFKIEKLIWGSFNFGPLLFNNKAANRFMKPTRSWKMRIRIKKKKIQSGQDTILVRWRLVLFRKNKKFTLWVFVPRSFSPHVTSIHASRSFPLWRMVITRPAPGLCLRSLPPSPVSPRSAFCRRCRLTSRWLFESLC